MWSSRRRLRAASSVVSWLCLVLVVGCPRGGGDGDGDGDGVRDSDDSASIVDAGCDGDDACGAGLICDLASATCVAGFDCSVNTTICAFCGGDDVDCGFGVAPAFCDEEASVCRRVKGACAPCSDDAECGVGETGLASVCHDGFCAPGCGPCAEGFVCADGGCVPAPSTTTTGTCEGAILCADGTPCPDGTTCSALGVCLALCDADVDCALGSICADTGPARGTCVAGCPYGQRVNVDGEDRICHGDGRFGPLCPTAGSQTGCPPSTECTSSGACDLAGCQSDAECPLPRTYCDLERAACVTGCNDASDCGAFERCDENVCVAQGCRGKDSSCNLGEFCCGQELFSDASTCPDDVADGACFLAPEPWCMRCDTDDDCASAERFGFAAYCFELRRQNPDTGQDESLGKFCSTGCRDNDDCPRGIGCMSLPTPDEGTTQGCLDARCAGYPADR